MNFNPMIILQMIQQGQNPEQLMLNFLEGQMNNTPMGANLINLARNNKTNEIEQIARNICASRGVNYDQAFNDFKKQFGLK